MAKELTAAVKIELVNIALLYGSEKWTLTS